MSIVSHSLATGLVKDRLSITGYVYKSLWNRFCKIGTLKAPANTEYTARIMALRLAVVGSGEQHVNKLLQQINITVAGCANVVDAESTGKAVLNVGLAQLQETVDKIVRGTDNNLAWKHLSLFISCLQFVNSTHHTDKSIHVSSEVSNNISASVEIEHVWFDASRFISYIFMSDKL